MVKRRLGRQRAVHRADHAPLVLLHAHHIQIDPPAQPSDFIGERQIGVRPPDLHPVEQSQPAPGSDDLTRPDQFPDRACDLDAQSAARRIVVRPVLVQMPRNRDLLLLHPGQQAGHHVQGSCPQCALDHSVHHNARRLRQELPQPLSRSRGERKTEPLLLRLPGRYGVVVPPRDVLHPLRRSYEPVRAQAVADQAHSTPTEREQTVADPSLLREHDLARQILSRVGVLAPPLDPHYLRSDPLGRRRFGVQHQRTGIRAIVS